MALWEIRLQVNWTSALIKFFFFYEISYILWFLDNDGDQDDLLRLEEAQLKEEERKGDMERMLNEAEANIEQLDSNR